MLTTVNLLFSTPVYLKSEVFSYKRKKLYNFDILCDFGFSAVLCKEFTEEN